MENGEDEETEEGGGKKVKMQRVPLLWAAFFIFSHSSLFAYPHKSEGEMPNL